MAESPTALILAAILLSSGFFLFSRPYQKQDSSCNCTTLSSVIFLTAVFAWVTAKNLNLFKCKLPDNFVFFYEFFVSLFIFEMAMRLFWEPLECFISSTLPAMAEDYLLSDGECALFGLFCTGDTILFTVLVYAMALSILWSVLYGYGVISGL